MAWRMADLAAYGGRAVLLIRNPLRAILSYWNHARTLSSTDVNLKLEDDLQTLEFKTFMENEIRHER